MGFTLASRKVTSISECVRKEMITYVEYDGPSPKRAITYPQYLVDEDKITRIDTTTFPEIGGLPVTLEGKTKEEYEGIFGRLVVMKTNVDVDQFMENNYYPIWNIIATTQLPITTGSRDAATSTLSSSEKAKSHHALFRLFPQTTG